MTRFLISGASIDGPALADWRLKAGYDITLVQRAPAPQRSFWAIHGPTRASNRPK
jgi:hypothetical protein